MGGAGDEERPFVLSFRLVLVLGLSCLIFCRFLVLVALRVFLLSFPFNSPFTPCDPHGDFVFRSSVGGVVPCRVALVWWRGVILTFAQGWRCPHIPAKGGVESIRAREEGGVQFKRESRLGCIYLRICVWLGCGAQCSTHSFIPLIYSPARIPVRGCPFCVGWARCLLHRFFIVCGPSQ
ncbi:hypothetical protein B0H12DRAFT_684346 [Mycena haematopus]|nr:hypothetical protein B0H12DRAFT_684346 [Mycena haematopus]